MLLIIGGKTKSVFSFNLLFVTIFSLYILPNGVCVGSFGHNTSLLYAHLHRQCDLCKMEQGLWERTYYVGNIYGIKDLGPFRIDINTDNTHNNTCCYISNYWPSFFRRLFVLLVFSLFSFDFIYFLLDVCLTFGSFATSQFVIGTTRKQNNIKN